MNRLQGFHQHAAHQHSSKHRETATASDVASARLSRGRGGSTCTFFAPLHYEPNYAYPLLIWLHGPCDSENQLKRIMPLVSMRNYVGVGLRGTSIASHRGREAYDWSQSPADLALAEQRLFDSLDMARDRFHVAPARVFLAGLQTGGTIALRLALAHPDRFAGVLSIGGELPAGHMPPLKRLQELRKLPVFLACGRDSVRYPTTAVCDDLRLFHAAGMSIALRQYPCGDELTTHMLSDMDRWIMEQVTSGSTCARS